MQLLLSPSLSPRKPSYTLKQTSAHTLAGAPSLTILPAHIESHQRLPLLVRLPLSLSLSLILVPYSAGALFAGAPSFTFSPPVHRFSLSRISVSLSIRCCWCTLNQFVAAAPPVLSLNLYSLHRRFSLSRSKFTATCSRHRLTCRRRSRRRQSRYFFFFVFFCINIY